MFFRRKLPIDVYCRTRLDLLFSIEQAEDWLTFKRTSLDQAIIGVDESLYLAHLRAASIELISMAVTKKYKSIDLFIQMSTFIDKYLDNNNAGYVKALLDLYGHALGSPVDGVGAMSGLMMESLCQNRCSEETRLYFRDFFYVGLGSIRQDFKKVKLLAG